VVVVGVVMLVLFLADVALDAKPGGGSKVDED
jgi:hypothetical protein